MRVRVLVHRFPLHRVGVGLKLAQEDGDGRRETEKKARHRRRRDDAPPPLLLLLAIHRIIVFYYARSRRVGRVRMCSFRCGLLINDGWDVQNDDDDDDGVQKNALF